MARQYNKKSPYWENRKSISSVAKGIIEGAETVEGSPEFFNISFSQEAIAEASRTTRTNTSSRVNSSAVGTEWGQYNQIRKAILPFEYNSKGNSYDIREAIDIVQRAYASVGAVRTAIDVQAELANDGVFLDGGSKKARDFFNAWFEVVELDACKEQFFREYYRSGNVFLYALEGELNLDASNSVTTLLKKAKVKIPIKFTLLNPYDISCCGELNFSRKSYGKMLSLKEIERIKNPITEKDKNLRKSLPKETLKQIDNSYGFESILFPLDGDSLSISFYKKQDYEPFAIPMVWPVLRDVNMKLEMKKLDAAAMRTVDQIVLLLTMGAEPQKGGINDRYMREMKDLLSNGSVGRMLVSDWTTEAKFIVPDIHKILGKEKYEVLNQDIRDGLMNILNLDGTYSGLSTKLKIYMRTLQEARRHFLSDFLIPQMERVGKKLGFKKIPKPKFKEIDFENKEALQRVALRLYELGAISPQQLMHVFDSGVYPSADQIKPEQEEFLEDRKKGFYNPVVGGVPVISSKSEQERIELSREQMRLNQQQEDSTSLPPLNPSDTTNQTSKTAGRPAGTANASKTYSMKAIKSISEYFNKIADKCVAESKEFVPHETEKELSDKVFSVLTIVGMACPVNKWKEETMKCLRNPENLMFLEPVEGVKALLDEHENLNNWGALILYHSEH